MRVYQKYNVWGGRGGKRDKKIKKAKERREGKKKKSGEQWVEKLASMQDLLGHSCNYLMVEHPCK